MTNKQHVDAGDTGRRKAAVAIPENITKGMAHILVGRDTQSRGGAREAVLGHARPYIPANMLRAVMQEVGNDAGDLLIGAKRRVGCDSLLVHTVAEKVAAEQQGEERDLDEEEIEEEDEDTYTSEY
ncbi:uncharacterized protein BJX67DRAFT_379526 [Aspergillus lucknowensis]|uniref:Histone H2A n=1 Tax=Aspergillus lucknowensis TaxID=176173 RepID=A0ABR4LWX9_9EURO